MDAPITDEAFERSIEAMRPSEIYFSLRGRIPRRIFWIYGIGAMFGLGTMGWMLLTIAGMPPERADRLMALLLFWPTLAISVKRWHDRDKSGWWVLLYLVPVIGTIWLLIENGLLRGTPGENRFGPPLHQPA